MPEESITKRFLSIELIIAMLVPMMAGAFAYGQLSNNVDSNQASVDALKKQEQQTQHSVGQIKTDIAVVKTRLENISKSVDDAAEQSEENSRTLQKILSKLNGE